MILGLWGLGKSGKKSIVLEMKYPFQAVPNFSNPFGFLKAFDFKRSPLTAADLGSCLNFAQLAS